jgi:uncharacterized cupredoxin-like copper-binding protein
MLPIIGATKSAKEQNMYQRKIILTILIAGFLVPLLVACGGGSSASNGPVDVQVALSEFKFESSLTTFKVGVPYHFIVTNNGTVPHELMIMKPMETPAGMDMEEMDKMALALIEEDDLPVGATATLDYTFTEPAASGELEFACHTPGHYEAGMKLPIIVESQ